MLVDGTVALDEEGRNHESARRNVALRPAEGGGRSSAMRSMIGVGLVMLLLVAACSGGATEEATTSPATEPTVVTTTTSAPATTVSTSTAEPSSGVVEVIFDGVGCTVAGPPTVPAGTRIFFVLTNNSDIDTADLTLYVARLLDGHEFQDLLDLQAEVGGPPNYYPRQEWLVTELRDLDPEAASGVEVADNQILDVRILTEGEDAIYVGDYRLWFCAPLEVTGA